MHNPLRLLPFGSDRIGERLVRQLSRGLYGDLYYYLQADSHALGIKQ